MLYCHQMYTPWTRHCSGLHRFLKGEVTNTRSCELACTLLSIWYLKLAEMETQLYYERGRWPSTYIIEYELTHRLQQFASIKPRPKEKTTAARALLPSTWIIDLCSEGYGRWQIMLVGWGLWVVLKSFFLCVSWLHVLLLIIIYVKTWSLTNKSGP